MRNPGRNDYDVQVEGIGKFKFARRSLGDELKVQVEYARITEGVMQPTPWLYSLGTWLSALRVLMVAAPDGWDMEAMDPLEDDTYDQIKKVYEAMREKEDSFRRKPGKASEASSQGDGQDRRVLVPEEVQSPAE